MISKVKVVTPEEYDRWQKIWEWEKQLGISTSIAAEKTTVPGGLSQKPSVEQQPIETPIDRGKRLFTEKGCTACHTVDRKPLIGPTLKGIFGHEVELADGKKVQVDENYIRESIVNPTVKVVKGFQPVMPAYKGSLKDEEINALVSYIKSLGD